MEETTTPIVLIVEDEDVARKNLEHILKRAGYQVVAAKSGVKALELLAQREFDLVLTDLKMEKVDGMAVLKKSRQLQPLTEVIMITGYATVRSAVDAMQHGAYYYIAKPYKIDEVRRISGEAILKRQLRLENLQLKEALKKTGEAPPIIGHSEAIVSIARTIRQIAASDTNVLILGESGTGKELVAKTIHHLSTRAEKRFVAFNCGSFTEELMANELFGHEKGAFTGAVKEKPGLVEVADGGTVFLDEVGDMPLTMQVKLLRVIQEKEFLRVGGTDPVSVDVRFIAATHRDLAKDMEEGLFRQDLYYRLNVITLKLPPLAERAKDIPLLARHFLVEKARAMGKEVHEIDREAMDLLCKYGWPGNVRELENVIERAVAMQNGTAIRAMDLPDYIRNLSIETYRHSDSGIPTLETQERHYINWVLEKCHGNKTEAAKLMGIDRVSLWRKLKRYGMEE
ncbi:MAG: sigma-54-dependent Fis family transcriptional regulator [Deltaproteobacteria bacterium]|nr:sigma-54-dependent Fis family transcriptional regulator [Deltaproteobacteria bacterium]